MSYRAVRYMYTQHYKLTYSNICTDRTFTLPSLQLSYKKPYKVLSTILLYDLHRLVIPEKIITVQLYFARYFHEIYGSFVKQLFEGKKMILNTNIVKEMTTFEG